MDAERKRLFDGWLALRAACRKQHPGGPGGAAMCICGAGGGGSVACSMLATVRNALLHIDPEDVPNGEWFALLQSVL